MDWRGPGALVALVAIGCVGGYAVSDLTRDSTIGSGVAAPVAAQGPASPVPTTQPYAPDPPDPPLLPDIALEPTTAGEGKTEIAFPIPVGWRQQANAGNEWKWKKPGTSNNSYVLRIEQITSRKLTLDEAIAARVQQLEEKPGDFTPLTRDDDSLEYTSRSSENTARHSFMRWLDLDDDGRADVEIVVHGREADVPGTRDLIERVSDGMSFG